MDGNPQRKLRQATTHGRDHVQEVELAGTKDGTITGLRCSVLGRNGRLPLDRGPWHSDDPARLDAVGLTYDIPAIKEDVYGVYTNTVPVEAYRGAGRPEATFMFGSDSSACLPTEYCDPDVGCLLSNSVTPDPPADLWPPRGAYTGSVHAAESFAASHPLLDLAGCRAPRSDAAV